MMMNQQQQHYATNAYPNMSGQQNYGGMGGGMPA